MRVCVCVCVFSSKFRIRDKGHSPFECDVLSCRVRASCALIVVSQNMTSLKEPQHCMHHAHFCNQKALLAGSLLELLRLLSLLIRNVSGHGGRLVVVLGRVL